MIQYICVLFLTLVTLMCMINKLFGFLIIVLFCVDIFIVSHLFFDMILLTVENF